MTVSLSLMVVTSSPIFWTIPTPSLPAVEGKENPKRLFPAIYGLYTQDAPTASISKEVTGEANILI